MIDDAQKLQAARARISELKRALIDCVQCIETDVRHADGDHPVIEKHARVAKEARRVVEKREDF